MDRVSASFFVITMFLSNRSTTVGLLLQSKKNPISKNKLKDQANRIRENKNLFTNLPEKLVPSRDELYYPSNYEQQYSPRGFCNSLLPNRIIIGQYPGQTPENHSPTKKEVEEHLQKLIVDESNVRLFISLQNEVPDQDDLEAWNVVNGKKRLPLVGGRMEFPNYFSHYAPLVKRIAMNERNNNAVSFLHSPILDLSTPNSTSLMELLSTILDWLEEREDSIYIHCWGGRGRAGLVGSCLLSILFPELESKTCLEWIQRGYDTRDGAKYMPRALQNSPQTTQQIDFVHKFVTNFRQE